MLSSSAMKSVHVMSLANSMGSDESIKTNGIRVMTVLAKTEFASQESPKRNHFSHGPNRHGAFLEKIGSQNK